MKVDFYRHDLGESHAKAVADVIKSPFLTTGRVARAVEQQLGDYFALPHALLSTAGPTELWHCGLRWTSRLMMKLSFQP